MRALCLNAGSSSLKAAGFAIDATGDEPARAVSLSVDRIDADPARSEAYVDALDGVAAACDRDEFVPDVIAHRLVHGGPELLEHTVITDAVRAELDRATAFAPLHLPGALAVLDAARNRFSAAVQVGCLDTAFHRRLPPAARRLPLGADLDAAGIRRYGFHGLSYEYLVHRLGDSLGRRAVLAHLGNGASLAAVLDGVGVDTTMGLTPAGGIMMGTRPGDLDPGVLLYMLRAGAVDTGQLERVVDRESGLLAVSERSADVRDLLAAREDGDGRATLALEMYESIAAKHVAGFTTVLRGLDTLVFTGGVGEHAAAVRHGIAARLTHLGVAVDAAANEAGAPVISEPRAAVTVRVEPTDEEFMMAVHAARLVG